MASRVCRVGEDEFEISYEIVNPKEKRAILFLHGWGSNKEIMRGAFGDKLKAFKHIYIDMPGFGNSPNDKFLKSSDYAKIVESFLDSLGIEAESVAGHSFGGKVATLLNPKHLVLLSSAGILIEKPLSIKIKIAIFSLLRKIGLSKFRNIFISSDAKGMNEGMYQTFKYVVNEDFEENFTKVTGKATIFWGKSDTATPLWSGEKIASLIPNSKFYPLDGDHFFFLKHSQFISDEIAKESES